MSSTTEPQTPPSAPSPPQPPTGEDKYCCPECGKCFTSIQALRGHCNVTGHRFPEELKRRKTVTKKHTEEHEEASVPDPYQHLAQMLKAFGLSEKNITAVITFMKPYSVDNLFKLTEVLREYMPKSKLKLFIESWANVRGIPIPYRIKRELGIGTMNMPTYTQPGFVEDPEVREALMLLERKGLKTDVLFKRQENGREISGIYELLKVLVEKLVPSPPTSTPNDGVVQSLMQENARLRERLEKLEEELEKRKLIEPIQKELNEVKQRLEKVSQTTNAQVEFIRGIFDIAKEGINIYKSVIERVKPVPPPERKSVGNPESIVELINQMGGEIDEG